MFSSFILSCGSLAAASARWMWASLKPGTSPRVVGAPTSRMKAISARATASPSARPCEAVDRGIRVAGIPDQAGDQLQRALDGGGEEDRVVGVQQAAGAAVAQDVHQAEARQMRAVGAADHDGVTAEVGGQAEPFAGFEVRGIAQGLRQVLQHQADALPATSSISG